MGGVSVHLSPYLQERFVAAAFICAMLVNNLVVQDCVYLAGTTASFS